MNVYLKFKYAIPSLSLNSYASPVNKKKIDGYLNFDSDIKKNVDLLSDNNVFIVNTPYDSNAYRNKKKNKKEDRERRRIYSRMLRGRVYNPFDPMVYISENKEEKNEKLKSFLDEYSLDPIITTFDKQGFRSTVPYVDSDKIFLVLGDSVAYGLSLNDDETLSSQLQQKFMNVRFINDGLGGGTPLDLRKRLKNHLELFNNNVVGLIYIQTESDYNINNTPETIMIPIVNLIKNFKVLRYKAIVHQEYIYQTMPDIFRGKFSFDFGGTKKVKGRDEEELIKFNQNKKEIFNIASKNGFITVDFYDLLQKYRKEKRNTFAGFSLYVDHCHFSREGIWLIVSSLENSIENYIKTIK